jgi:hypothetical protein
MLDPRECQQLVVALANCTGVKIGGRLYLPLSSVVSFINCHTEEDITVTLEEDRIIIGGLDTKPGVPGLSECPRCGELLDEAGACGLCAVVNRTRELF